MDIDVQLIRQGNIAWKRCPRSMKLRKLKKWYAKIELKRNPNCIVFINDSSEPIEDEDIELGDLIPDKRKTLSIYIEENPILLNFNFGLTTIDYLYGIANIGQLRKYILEQLCFYLEDKIILMDENHRILSKTEKISDLILRFGAPTIYVKCIRKNYSKNRKIKEFENLAEYSFLESTGSNCKIGCFTSPTNSLGMYL